MKFLLGCNDNYICVFFATHVNGYDQGIVLIMRLLDKSIQHTNDGKTTVTVILARH